MNEININSEVFFSHLWKILSKKEMLHVVIEINKGCNNNKISWIAKGIFTRKKLTSWDNISNINIFLVQIPGKNDSWI